MIEKCSTGQLILSIRTKICSFFGMVEIHCNINIGNTLLYTVTKTQCISKTLSSLIYQRTRMYSSDKFYYRPSRRRFDKDKREKTVLNVEEEKKFSKATKA